MISFVTCLGFCLIHRLLLSPRPLCVAVLDKDFSSAKALYEQIKEEGATIDELSLKRLAGLYREAEETVPFTEPPVSLTHTH